MAHCWLSTDCLNRHPAVRQTEFRRIYRGMKKAQAHRISISPVSLLAGSRVATPAIMDLAKRSRAGPGRRRQHPPMAGETTASSRRARAGTSEFAEPLPAHIRVCHPHRSSPPPQSARDLWPPSPAGLRIAQHACVRLDPGKPSITAGRRGGIRGGWRPHVPVPVDEGARLDLA